ncbi:MAG: hypothetical protein OEW39_00935, partial [Deltaproteobacteria bacterium]|nr:hypothetical protein [Deltaproteobacteria bacterium]
RSFHMVGAGIRGGGKMLWRMEVSTTNRKDFLGTNGLSIKPGYMLNQGSLELGAANMFIGYTTYNAKEKSNGPTLKGGIADFSISFMRGIGITGRYEKNQVNTAAMENAKWERVKSITASMMY